ncbi:uncharacterized protein LOC129875835 [Solanum dulcamara]|uniref:uncharacterized protein LOC129875835 n=1 Tax=Solanum dulcamara TaxID=45834 RepID=UPI0024856A44|nr:uncharacterized protein LOC129875835 [Solanum dulcamara]
MPENENAYGVYGQLPPSTPTPNTNLIPNNKYLRKNYNPVAYVTVPRDNTDDDNNNNNSHRYNSGSSDDHYYRGDNTYDNDNNNNNNNNNEYYISGNTYNHYYRGDNTYDNNDDNNNNYQYHNADRAGSKVTISSIEPSLNGDNHEYYYINNHQEQSPNTYENSREFANFYVANNELSNNNYNNFVNYENEEEFQDEEHMP